MAVGHPDGYPFEAQAAVAGEMLKTEDIAVAPYGVHRGDVFKLGKDAGEADVTGVEDGGYFGLFKGGNRFLGEFSGPVGDVGVGDHAKGEHGGNGIMESKGEDAMLPVFVRIMVNMNQARFGVIKRVGFEFVSMSSNF